MKYQVLFSLKNNEKVFINLSAAVVIGASRVNGSVLYHTLLVIVHTIHYYGKSQMGH